MRVIAFRVPPFDNSVYILVDDRRDAIVIDPSMAEREVMAALRDERLRLLAILNTHGHNDHIYGNPPETRVYPGHGPPTSIGTELPWLGGFRLSEGATLR